MVCVVDGEDWRIPEQARHHSQFTKPVSVLVLLEKRDNLCRTVSSTWDGRSPAPRRPSPQHHTLPSRVRNKLWHSAVAIFTITEHPVPAVLCWRRNAHR